MHMVTFSNEYFHLALTSFHDSTKIRMEVLIDTVTTVTIPHTYSLLSFHLPSIFRSKCFNENNYPFSKEVRNTEIGHLFEHILLEYLSIMKSAAGHPRTVHNGLTSWNWQAERKGIFHIEIDAGFEDRQVLLQALYKTTILTKMILEKRQKNTSLQESIVQADSITA